MQTFNTGFISLVSHMLAGFFNRNNVRKSDACIQPRLVLKSLCNFAHCIPQANAATACTTYHFKSWHAPIAKAGCGFLEISEKYMRLYVCLCICLSFRFYAGKLLLKACEK